MMKAFIAALALLCGLALAAPHSDDAFVFEPLRLSWWKRYEGRREVKCWFASPPAPATGGTALGEVSLMGWLHIATRRPWDS